MCRFQKAILILIVSITSNSIAQKFSKSDILYDLEFLKLSLEEAHINLYAYTTKEDFNKNYLEVKSTIKKDSFTTLEANKIFQNVVSKANNGHTRIPFPVQSYFEYAQNGGTIFPLEIAFENGKALIRKNWSKQKNIEIGSELKSINGKSIKKIIKEISQFVSAERHYFKLAQIENLSLPRYYWLVYGKQDKFEVEIIQNNKIKKITLSAIGVIEDYEMKRSEILDERRFVKFYAEAAYLHPGKFGGNLDEYKQFIDSAFTEITLKESKNLIIDLRNHSGSSVLVLLGHRSEQRGHAWRSDIPPCRGRGRRRWLRCARLGCTGCRSDGSCPDAGSRFPDCRWIDHKGLSGGRGDQRRHF